MANANEDTHDPIPAAVRNMLCATHNRAVLVAESQPDMICFRDEYNTTNVTVPADPGTYCFVETPDGRTVTKVYLGLERPEHSILTQDRDTTSTEQTQYLSRLHDRMVSLFRRSADITEGLVIGMYEGLSHDFGRELDAYHGQKFVPDLVPKRLRRHVLLHFMNVTITSLVAIREQNKMTIAKEVFGYDCILFFPGILNGPVSIDLAGPLLYQRESVFRQQVEIIHQGKQYYSFGILTGPWQPNSHHSS